MKAYFEDRPTRASIAAVQLVFCRSGKYCATVKILVEISTVQHDRLLRAVSEASFVYSILKNGVIIDRSKASLERKTVDILCTVEQARALLDTAKELCPAAAPEIEDGLVNPRPFEP